MNSIRIVLSASQYQAFCRYLQAVIFMDSEDIQERLLIVLMTRLQLRLNSRFVNPKMTINLKAEEAIAYYLLCQTRARIEPNRAVITDQYQRMVVMGVRDQIHQKMIA